MFQSVINALFEFGVALADCFAVRVPGNQCSSVYAAGKCRD